MPRPCALPIYFTHAPSPPSPCSSGVKIFVNLQTTEKVYTGKGEHLCPRDGFVCFHNSHLISGRLGKVTLGGGNKAGLFQVRRGGAGRCAGLAANRGC